MEKTCTLQIDVTYDPQLTNPDQIADALDKLLETALSTHGLLADHGNPLVGVFVPSEFE